MNLAAAFIDYMNDEISADEYLSFYPENNRADIKIPIQKPIKTIPFNSSEDPLNLCRVKIAIDPKSKFHTTPIRFGGEPWNV